ncbi:probable MFS transporter [marine gamma proteobacterium HTCC2080]|jgi:MFS family permease|nr:probable MFS transporter [marine gamma proteobacterium HTCC2080]MBT6365078.1 MFS transporter [Bacteroidota bacterium]
MDKRASSHAWWALALLTATYTFSFVDRQIVNLLVDPIRTDLELSDSQVSFLQGLAFALPYVLLSIPVGRIVDRANRIRVLIIGILIWTISCMMCGTANSFWQLGIARMGIGGGEASVTPASWSLLADYFPPEQRALPISIFLMGPYLGAGLSLLLGAEVISWASGLGQIELPIVGVIAPWQLTFMLVALPGVVIALLLPLLKEPVRQERLGTDAQAMTWKKVGQYIWPRRQLFGAYLLGSPFLVLVLYALQAWIPSLLVRVHELDIVQAGRYYGTIALIAGSAGVLSGPVFARWLSHRVNAERAPLIVIFISILVLIPFVIAAGLATSLTAALIFISFASYWVTFPLALFATGLQNASPNELRGLMAGCYVLATNLIGLALGPSSVALVSDYVFQSDTAVGKSLALIAAIFLPLAALLVWRGLRAMRKIEAQEAS